MEYRRLGRSGLKVSELCLGTMTFGWNSGEAESRQMLDRFTDLGGNFIDTADIYAEGESEAILGRWLKNQPRDQLVIATKVRFATGTSPNDQGLGRKHIMSAVDASLRRLATDYIDLYQLHCWDEKTPLEESLAVMDALVRSGKVRYVGISNVTGWQLQLALDSCRQLGFMPLCSLQALYNLLDRYVEWDLIPVCRHAGLGVMCWSPLAGGWLTGRIRPGMDRPPGGRIAEAEEKGWSESWRNYNEPRTWTVLRALLDMAEKLGRPPAQVALNWLRRRPGVICPVIGAETIGEFEENVSALQWRLDDESYERLNQASHQPAPRYPYGFIARFNPGMREAA